MSLSSSITQAAAYCIKKGMTLVTPETSYDFDIISAIAKGERVTNTNNGGLHLFLKILLEKKIGEIWTSGFVEKLDMSCESNQTIRWCLSNKTSTVSWWSEKFPGLDNSAVSKYVTLKDGVFSAAIDTTNLPFACKVGEKIFSAEK